MAKNSDSCCSIFQLSAFDISGKKKKMNFYCSSFIVYSIWLKPHNYIQSEDYIFLDHSGGHHAVSGMVCMSLHQTVGGHIFLSARYKISHEPGSRFFKFKHTPLSE